GERHLHRGGAGDLGYDRVRLEAAPGVDHLVARSERHHLAVVEDAAQAVGAEDRGRRAGSLGRVGCFSFYPTKNLGAAGEAGMLTTDDERLAERLRRLRVHGGATEYHHDE